MVVVGLLELGVRKDLYHQCCDCVVSIGAKVLNGKGGIKLEQKFVTMMF